MCFINNQQINFHNTPVRQVYYSHLLHGQAEIEWFAHGLNPWVETGLQLMPWSPVTNTWSRHGLISQDENLTQSTLGLARVPDLSSTFLCQPWEDRTYLSQYRAQQYQINHSSTVSFDLPKSCCCLKERSHPSATCSSPSTWWSYEACGLLAQGTAWGKNQPCWDKKKKKVKFGQMSTLPQPSSQLPKQSDRTSKTRSKLGAHSLCFPYHQITGHVVPIPQTSAQETKKGLLSYYFSPMHLHALAQAAFSNSLPLGWNALKPWTLGVNLGLTEQLTRHYPARAQLFSV